MITNKDTNNSKDIFLVLGGVFLVFLLFVSSIAGIGFLAFNAVKERNSVSQTNPSTSYDDYYEDDVDSFFDNLNGITPSPNSRPNPSVTYPNAVTGDRRNLLILPKKNPILGSTTTAKVAVIQFADYDCPACQLFLKNSFPKIKSEYIDKGTVVYGYKDFPLESIHPNAIVKANAARCVATQNIDVYFNFLEQVINIEEFNQKALISKINQLGKINGLNVSQLTTCITNKEYYSDIRADVKEAARFGINSTPTFLVGTFDKDSNLVKGEILISSSFTEIQKVVEKYLIN